MRGDKPRPYGDHLYVIAMQDCVKVGRSCNVQRRLDEIQRGVPMFQTRLLQDFPGQGWQERRVHRFLKEARIANSEWFRLPAEEALERVRNALVTDLTQWAYTG